MHICSQQSCHCRNWTIFGINLPQLLNWTLGPSLSLFHPISDKLHVNLGLCNISRVTLEICRTHPLSWNADIKTPDLETCELVDHTVGICSIYNGWWSVLWLNRPGLPLLCVLLHCLMPLLQTNNVHVYSRSKVYKVCDFISWMGG